MMQQFVIFKKMCSFLENGKAFILLLLNAVPDSIFVANLPHLGNTFQIFLKNQHKINLKSK
jgi:hypothetical protein